MRWQRRGKYHTQMLNADGDEADYRVSRSGRPGGYRYTAWHGVLLTEGGRGYFPEVLGIFETADAAQDACEAHAELA